MSGLVRMRVRLRASVHARALPFSPVRASARACFMLVHARDRECARTLAHVQAYVRSNMCMCVSVCGRVRVHRVCVHAVHARE
eukprot:11740452-Alexandrium_andersonii.AAC.1